MGEYKNDIVTVPIANFCIVLGSKIKTADYIKFKVKLKEIMGESFVNNEIAYHLINDMIEEKLTVDCKAKILDEILDQMGASTQLKSINEKLED